MILSSDQAKSVLESPRQKSELERSVLYESRLRIFTDSKTLDQLHHEDGWNFFKEEVRTTLGGIRGDRAMDFCSFPLNVCDISDNVLTEVTKVFDAKNSFVSVISSNDVQDDYINSVVGGLDIFSWVKANGMKVLNNEPNSIVVVDFDQKGEPYLIYINHERLVDFGLKDKNGELDYVVFKHSEDGDDVLYAVYDDATYWVWRAVDGEMDKLVLESSKKNNAKRCPARMFMSETLNGGFDRRIPISTSLSRMSEWQRFQIYKNYADHYYPFPVIERMEEKCGNSQCDSGQILVGEREVQVDGVKFKRAVYDECPVCKGREDVIGPGLVVELEARGSKEDPDYSGNFKMITPDVSSLVYIGTKLSLIQDAIIWNSVGYNELLNTEAVNETQVQGSFESKTNVFLRLKLNFDTLHKWIIEQTILGVYGSMQDVSVNVNYGTEFYIYTETQIQEVFDSAKKSILPLAEITEIYKQLIETKYKGNPDKILRANMLFQLEPLPFDAWETAKLKFDAMVLDPLDFEFKSNFTNLVARFERENAPITKFGMNLPMDIRINNINKTIKTYLNGKAKQEVADPSNGSTGSE